MAHLTDLNHSPVPPPPALSSKIKTLESEMAASASAQSTLESVAASARQQLDSARAEAEGLRRALQARCEDDSSDTGAVAGAATAPGIQFQKKLDAANRSIALLQQDKRDLERKLEARKYNHFGSPGAGGSDDGVQTGLIEESTVSRRTRAGSGAGDQLLLLETEALLKMREQDLQEKTEKLQVLEVEVEKGNLDRGILDNEAKDLRGKLGQVMGARRELERELGKVTKELEELRKKMKDEERVKSAKDVGGAGAGSSTSKKENSAATNEDQDYTGTAPTSTSTVTARPVQTEEEHNKSVLRVAALEKENEQLKSKMDRIQQSEKSYEKFIVSMQRTVDESRKTLKGKEKEVSAAKADMARVKSELEKEVATLRQEKGKLDALETTVTGSRRSGGRRGA